MTLFSLAFAILFFVLMSAFFAGSETALTSINQIALKSRAEAGDRNAIRLLRILEDPDRMLVSTLVGTNLATVAASTLFSHFLLTRQSLSPEAMTALLLSPILLIFGEIIPKALFRQRSLLLMQELSGVLELSFKILVPISRVVQGVNILLLRCLRQRQTAPTTLFVTKAELKYLIQESEREGSLTAPERSLIYQIFGLGEKTVGEVMTPLSEVQPVVQTTAVADLIRHARESALTRIPVQGTEGDIVGFVNLFDVAYEENVTKRIEGFIRPCLFVQERTPVGEVLVTLQTKKSPMALVKDAGGQVKGLVMLEGLLGELVGVVSQTEFR